MSGYDPRIVSAMLGLGYDLFPFEAYDEFGRVKIPDSVDFPDHIKAGLGVVAQAPIWSKLYQTLSVLDDPQWKVFSAGVGFTGKSLNIVVFKSTGAEADPLGAHRWTEAYQNTVARTLRTYAGTHHLIDPKWMDLLRQAMSKAGGDGDKDKKPGGGQEVPAIAAAEEPPAGARESLEATGAPSWLLLGLKGILAVLGKFTPRNDIRTTVFWYRPSPFLFDQPFAERWAPLHVDYMQDGNLRTVHGGWEPIARPHIWSGAKVNWKRFLWAMPHDPTEWCQAMYPTLNCGSTLDGSTPGTVDSAYPADGVMSGESTDGVPPSEGL